MKFIYNVITKVINNDTSLNNYTLYYTCALGVSIAI